MAKWTFYVGYLAILYYVKVYLTGDYGLAIVAPRKKETKVLSYNKSTTELTQSITTSALLHLCDIIT